VGQAGGCQSAILAPAAAEVDVSVPAWGVRVKRQRQQQVQMQGAEVTYRQWPSGAGQQLQQQQQPDVGMELAGGTDVLSDTGSQVRWRIGGVSGNGAGGARGSPVILL
jgi:hypothetical protein